MNTADKIKLLRAEILALERKAQGIENAVRSKKKTLERLEAEAVLHAPLKSAGLMIAG